MTEPWYLIHDLNEIDSPALLIYKDRAQHNLSLAIQMVGDVSKLRPHVKTHKSPQLTKIMLGAGITKFKCATIAEAEMLAGCGAPDVLLAYQPVGPKIQRLLKLMQHYPGTQFSCLVDSAGAAKAMAKEAGDHEVTVPVFLDVNVGMNRTGVLPQNALAVYKECCKLKGITVVGLHGYDGHINDTDAVVRKQGADEAYNRLKQVEQTLEPDGLEQPVIVMGGSPTFSIHAKRKGLECSPGTFIYWDRSYAELFPDLNFLPAAVLLGRVISVVDEKKICLDLGHKSVAAENPLDRRVHFLNAGELLPVGQSEEHLVMETPAANSYKAGDVLYGIPYHVCPSCALYDRAYVVEEGKLKEEWQMTARDRKLSI